MTYGIPEAALIAVEKEIKNQNPNQNQKFDCLDCAIEGVFEPLDNVYMIKGTIYCYKHALVHKD